MSPPAPTLPVTFSALLESVDAPVVALERGGVVAWVNDAAEQWLGRSRERLVGRSIAASETWGPQLAALSEYVLRVGMAVHQEVEVDAAGLGLAGCPWWEGDSIRGVVVWVHIPPALARPERSDVAALAAGLAHEVRNPLAALRGAAELLSSELPTGASSIREYVDLILREAARVDGLVSRLLVASRPVPLNRTRFRADEVLHDLAREAKALAAARRLPVEVEEEYDPTLPALFADRARLSEALLNLAKNAVEALPATGGRVTLSAALDSKRHRTAAGSSALMAFSIRDTGPGLGLARERLFTPFFTTKASGTGLGLLMARRVAEAHGGVLTLRDRVPPETGVEAQVLIPIEATHG